MAADLVTVRRALVSVFDKSGLETLGPALAKHKVTVLSTGGTAKALRAAGVDVTDVADVTKWPEMLGKQQHQFEEGEQRKRKRQVFSLSRLSPSPLSVPYASLGRSVCEAERGACIYAGRRCASLSYTKKRAAERGRREVPCASLEEGARVRLPIALLSLFYLSLSFLLSPFSFLLLSTRALLLGASCCVVFLSLPLARSMLSPPLCGLLWPRPGDPGSLAAFSSVAALCSALSPALLQCRSSALV